MRRLALLAVVVALGGAQAYPLAPLPPPLGEGAEGGRQHGETLHGVPVSDARWLHPDTDLVEFLTQTPGECLSEATNDDAYLVEVGRALFRSPLILGGPAARYGLSCNSCHRDGRSNPHFFLEGFSGDPGTADVTSAHFSKTREDGSFNPKPIPDLVGAGDRSTFGSEGAVRDLKTFIALAVGDEFQGVASETAIAGLTAYVSALKKDACAGPETQSSRRGVDGARRAAAAARDALARSDPETAGALLLAARQELKRVAERHQGLQTEFDIATAASLLAEIGDLAETKPKRAARRLESLDAALDRLADRLHEAEPRSFYDEARLRELLTGPP